MTIVLVQLVSQALSNATFLFLSSIATSLFSIAPIVSPALGPCQRIPHHCSGNKIESQDHHKCKDTIQQRTIDHVLANDIPFRELVASILHTIDSDRQHIDHLQHIQSHHDLEIKCRNTIAE